jgi:hypothetical protein
VAEGFRRCEYRGNWLLDAATDEVRRKATGALGSDMAPVGKRRLPHSTSFQTGHGALLRAHEPPGLVIEPSIFTRTTGAFRASWWRTHKGAACVLCGGRNRPMDMHHVTRQRLGHELSTDVVPAHHQCHTRLHAAQRRRSA